MSTNRARTDVATERVLALIDDPALAARYPNGTHFIAVTTPGHGAMATEALFDGDPVALIYSDGREVLLTPERVGGLTGLLVAVLASVLSRAATRSDGDAVQLPPRTRIEARDSSGTPIAA